MRTANRKLRYFFKRADDVMMVCYVDVTIPTFRCGYNGKVYATYPADTKKKPELADYILDYPAFKEVMLRKHKRLD